MKKRIIARLFIKPECRESFLSHVATVVEKTRKEPGCLFYSLFEDFACPGSFLFYEEFVDQAAMEAHRASAHLAEFRTAMQPMHAKDRIVEVV